jgi:hypothetical protein
MTLTEQIRHALARGNTGTTLEEVLFDIDQGTSHVITVPGGHVVFAWTDTDSVEVITLYGDRRIAQNLYNLSRALGAEHWTWAGRKGWKRLIPMMEADYGRVR